MTETCKSGFLIKSASGSTVSIVSQFKGVCFPDILTHELMWNKNKTQNRGRENDLRPAETNEIFDKVRWMDL